MAEEVVGESLQAEPYKKVFVSIDNLNPSFYINCSGSLATEVRRLGLPGDFAPKIFHRASNIGAFVQSETHVDLDSYPEALGSIVDLT